MSIFIPKNNKVFIASVFLALSLGLYFFGLLKVYSSLAKIEEIYTNTESDLSKQQKVFAIKSILAINGKDIKTLNDFLVQSGDEIKFIEKIENLANISGVSFKINSIETKKTESDIIKEDLVIDMSINSSWQSIISFVHNLERMDFGVSISEFNVDSDGGEDWSGKIQFKVFREIKNEN